MRFVLYYDASVCFNKGICFHHTVDAFATHLLVMPPPGGSPGRFTEARSFNTYSRLGSSLLSLSSSKMSVKREGDRGRNKPMGKQLSGY